jgi:hypothetical protein
VTQQSPSFRLEPHNFAHRIFIISHQSLNNLQINNMPSGTKRRRAPSSDSNHTPLPNAKRRINSKELFRKFNRKQKAAKQARIQKEWEGEFENTNEQINKSYGVLGNNSSITGTVFCMV